MNETKYKFCVNCIHCRVNTTDLTIPTFACNRNNTKEPDIVTGKEYPARIDCRHEREDFTNKDTCGRAGKYYEGKIDIKGDKITIKTIF